MARTQGLGKDIAIYGSSEFVFKFIAFAVFPIYAHVFSVAEFGLWALLSVSATLLGYFANLGVNQAVQRYYFDEAAEHHGTGVIVSSGLAQIVASSVVIVGAASFVALVFGKTTLAGYGISQLLLVLALANVIPDQLLQYCLDVLRLHFTPLRFAFLALVKNLLGNALALFLVLYYDAGLIGLFAGIVFGTTMAVPLGLWLIRKDLGWQIDFPTTRSLFAFGFPLTFASIAHWIYSSIDRWMLVDLSDPVQLGLFSTASKYATVLTFVVAAFAQAWIPYAIRLHRDDPDHRQVYANVLSLWFFVLSFIGLGVALFSNEALMLLTPASFWPAASLLPIIIAGIALFGTTQIFALGITLSKRTMLSTIGTWLAAGINVALNFWLIPRYGAAGAAIATLGSYGVLSLYFLVWNQRLHPIPIAPVKFAYCLVIVALTAAASTVDLGAMTGKAIVIKLGIVALVVVGAFAAGIVDRSMLRIERLKEMF